MANTRRSRKKTKVNTKKSRYEEENKEEEKKEEKEEKEEEKKEEEKEEEENEDPKRRRPNRIQRLELIEEPDLSSHSLSTIQSSFIDKEVSMPLTVRRVDDQDFDFIVNQHLTDIYTKIKIATDDVSHKLSSSNKNDWYVNLNSKLDLVPSMVYLELHGIGKHTLKKQVVDHILDTLPHKDRLLIAKHVKQPDFNIDTASPLEKHIAQYFDFLTINDSCLVLAKTKGVNRFYNIHDWSEMKVNADDKMYRERFFVDIDDLSDIIGYVEDEEFKIRENRRVFSMKSSKTELISEMNEILKLSGSNFWYDIATSKDKKKRNSDNLSHLALYAVMEMLIRKLNSFHKIWFLKPEQMAFMKS
jgi:hypothetical protein